MSTGGSDRRAGPARPFRAAFADRIHPYRNGGYRTAIPALPFKASAGHRGATLKMVEVRGESSNRNSAPGWSAGGAMVKMVDLDEETSNQVLDILRDWNEVLEAFRPPHSEQMIKEPGPDLPEPDI